jgi:4'-phosphopantetheinyl transferase EntD
MNVTSDHAQVAVGLAVERRPTADADRAAAARAVRHAIAQFHAAVADTLALVHRRGAPPLALGGPSREALPYTISIAHRDGHAIAAAGRGGNCIGVDIERADSVEAAQLRMFATPAERNSGVEPTTLWVLKEAAWKALVCPSTMPFQSLQLEFSRGRLCGVRVNGRQLRAHAHVWSPWQGWLAAVVAIASNGGVQP